MLILAYIACLHQFQSVQCTAAYDMENSYADVQSCQMKNDEVNFPAKVNLTIDWVCVDWTEESKDKLLSYIIMRYGKMPKEKA